MRLVFILSIIALILISGCVNPDTDPKKMELVNCINSRGGMLYYSSSKYSGRWLGYAWRNLSKFDCDSNKEVCKTLGITTPAWRVNNTIVEGDLKFEELSELYGCNISQDR